MTKKKGLEQYPLFGGTPPHEPVDTSREAALKIEAPSINLREQVLGFIKKRGEHGSTDSEIEIALGMKHQTASARRRELVLLGRVEHNGDFRLTDSRRRARVWVYVEPEVIQ